MYKPKIIAKRKELLYYCLWPWKM